MENKTVNQGSSFKSGLKSLALFALALSGGKAGTTASAKSDDDSNPQSTKVPKECQAQLSELNQAVGAFAKVAEKLGTLEVPVKKATEAILARNSQNIKSCHEGVKNRHIQNGDVTFISKGTFGSYAFDEKLEKLPIYLSPQMQGYAVFDPKKISKSDAKDIKALRTCSKTF